MYSAGSRPSSQVISVQFLNDLQVPREITSSERKWGYTLFLFPLHSLYPHARHPQRDDTIILRIQILLYLQTIRLSTSISRYGSVSLYAYSSGNEVSWRPSNILRFCFPWNEKYITATRESFKRHRAWMRSRFTNFEMLSHLFPISFASKF